MDNKKDNSEDEYQFIPNITELQRETHSIRYLCMFEPVCAFISLNSLKKGSAQVILNSLISKNPPYSFLGFTQQLYPASEFHWLCICVANELHINLTMDYLLLYLQILEKSKFKFSLSFLNIIQKSQSLTNRKILIPQSFEQRLQYENSNSTQLIAQSSISIKEFESFLILSGHYPSIFRALYPYFYPIIKTIDINQIYDQYNFLLLPIMNLSQLNVSKVSFENYDELTNLIQRTILDYRFYNHYFPNGFKDIENESEILFKIQNYFFEMNQFPTRTFFNDYSIHTSLMNTAIVTNSHFVDVCWNRCKKLFIENDDKGALNSFSLIPQLQSWSLIAIYEQKQNEQNMNFLRDTIPSFLSENSGKKPNISLNFLNRIVNDDKLLITFNQITGRKLSFNEGSLPYLLQSSGITFDIDQIDRLYNTSLFSISDDDRKSDCDYLSSQFLFINEIKCIRNTIASETFFSNLNSTFEFVSSMEEDHFMPILIDLFSLLFVTDKQSGEFVCSSETAHKILSAFSNYEISEPFLSVFKRSVKKVQIANFLFPDDHKLNHILVPDSFLFNYALISRDWSIAQQLEGENFKLKRKRILFKSMAKYLDQKQIDDEQIPLKIEIYLSDISSDILVNYELVNLCTEWSNIINELQILILKINRNFDITFSKENNELIALLSPKLISLSSSYWTKTNFTIHFNSQFKKLLIPQLNSQIKANSQFPTNTNLNSQIQTNANLDTQMKANLNINKTDEQEINQCNIQMHQNDGVQLNDELTDAQDKTFNRNEINSKCKTKQNLDDSIYVNSHLKKFFDYLDMFIESVLELQLTETVYDSLKIDSNEIIYKLYKNNHIEIANKLAVSLKFDLIEVLIEHSKELNEEIPLLKDYSIVNLAENLFSRNFEKINQKRFEKVKQLDISTFERMKNPYEFPKPNKLQIKDKKLASQSISIHDYDSYVFSQYENQSDLFNINNVPTEFYEKKLIELISSDNLDIETISELSYNVTSNFFDDLLKSQLEHLDLNEVKQLCSISNCTDNLSDSVQTLINVSKNYQPVFPLENSFKHLLFTGSFKLASEMCRLFRFQMKASKILREVILNMLYNNKSVKLIFQVCPELAPEIIESLPVRFKEKVLENQQQFFECTPLKWKKLKTPKMTFIYNLSDDENAYSIFQRFPFLNVDSDLMSLFRIPQFTISNCFSILEKIELVTRSLKKLLKFFRNPNEVCQFIFKQLIGIIHQISVRNNELLIETVMHRLYATFCETNEILSNYFTIELANKKPSQSIVRLLTIFPNYCKYVRVLKNFVSCSFNTKFGIQYDFSNFESVEKVTQFVNICFFYDFPVVAMRFIHTWNFNELLSSLDKYALNIFVLGRYEDGLKLAVDRRLKKSLNTMKIVDSFVDSCTYSQLFDQSEISKLTEIPDQILTQNSLENSIDNQYIIDRENFLFNFIGSKLKDFRNLINPDIRKSSNKEFCLSIKQNEASIRASRKYLKLKAPLFMRVTKLVINGNFDKALKLVMGKNFPIQSKHKKQFNVKRITSSISLGDMNSEMSYNFNPKIKSNSIHIPKLDLNSTENTNSILINDQNSQSRSTSIEIDQQTIRQPLDSQTLNTSNQFNNSNVINSDNLNQIKLNSNETKANTSNQLNSKESNSLNYTTTINTNNSDQLNSDTSNQLTSNLNQLNSDNAYQSNVYSNEIKLNALNQSNLTDLNSQASLQFNSDNDDSIFANTSLYKNLTIDNNIEYFNDTDSMQDRWNLFLENVFVVSISYSYFTKMKVKLIEFDPHLRFFGSLVEKLLKDSIKNSMPHLEFELEMFLGRSDLAVITSIGLFQKDNSIKNLENALKAVSKELNQRKSNTKTTPTSIPLNEIERYSKLIPLQLKFMKFIQNRGFDSSLYENMSLFNNEKAADSMVLFLFKQSNFKLAIEIIHACQLNLFSIADSFIVVLLNESTENCLKIIKDFELNSDEVFFEKFFNRMMLTLIYTIEEKEQALSFINKAEINEDFRIKLLIQFGEFEQALEHAKKWKLFDLMPLIAHEALTKEPRNVALTINANISNILNKNLRSTSQDF